MFYKGESFLMCHKLIILNVRRQSHCVRIIRDSFCTCYKAV